jgi:hypothetical protein
VPRAASKLDATTVDLPDSLRLRRLFILLVLTLVSVVLAGCDRQGASAWGAEAVATARVTKAAHARRNEARRHGQTLRSLLHAHAEPRGEALYEDDDDDDDDLGLAAPGQQDEDDDAAGAAADAAATAPRAPTARPRPVRLARARGLRPAGGFPRPTEHPPRN